VLETWRKGSVHGRLWAKGSADGPVCTTCHESHAIDDPIMPRPLLGFADECGDCHGEFYSSYRGNFHGKFTQLGLVTSATCSDCHSPHRILPVDDPGSSVHPDRLGETCGNCHEGAAAAFLQIDPHSDPTDPDDNRYVYYVNLFMVGLLIGVFAFFGIHDLLWLQRSAIGSLRGELVTQRTIRGGPYVRRFRGTYIVTHVIVILTFLVLALTGLPLKFDTAPWAKTLMHVVGGIDSARILHRIAAIVTFGYLAFHLIHILIRWLICGERGLFRGPNSMVPQLQDLKDVIANVRYFLYLGPRPEADRWTYWEKFDYLAVFWGVSVIGLSGLMLWWPAFFTNFLPGWTINAAYVVHSDEALLATGFIFVFHFIHTHLRPESFPMDPVVFTGRMPLERFKQERPREYQRMLDEGTLETAFCAAPSREEMGWVRVFGFTAVATGLALAVGIFWALLTQ
jgi:cytochrome b subunit of formate dehydrogenase